jgi:hypothetical protein
MIKIQNHKNFNHEEHEETTKQRSQKTKNIIPSPLRGEA